VSGLLALVLPLGAAATAAPARAVAEVEPPDSGAVRSSSQWMKASNHASTTPNSPWKRRLSSEAMAVNRGWASFGTSTGPMPVDRSDEGQVHGLRVERAVHREAGAVSTPHSSARLTMRA